MARVPILSEISRRRKLRLILSCLPPEAEVLEIGAGCGWFSERLRDRGHQVTTLDIVPPADIVGDINDWRSLDIAPASFDAVVALEVIEHVDCLQALRDICRPGGVIALSSPHPHWDWVMRILEALRLTQLRTSPHTGLVDFRAIPLPATALRRPAWIHQVGVFRNVGPDEPPSGEGGEPDSDAAKTG